MERSIILDLIKRHVNNCSEEHANKLLASWNGKIYNDDTVYLGGRKWYLDSVAKRKLKQK